jgi:hypothetical protein
MLEIYVDPALLAEAGTVDEDLLTGQ